MKNVSELFCCVSLLFFITCLGNFHILFQFMDHLMIKLALLRFIRNMPQCEKRFCASFQAVPQVKNRPEIPVS